MELVIILPKQGGRQVVEHWRRRLDEIKRNGDMTEHQKRNHTITVSTLMKLLKAEMDGLGDACNLYPDFRKPASSTQWRPIG